MTSSLYPRVPIPLPDQWQPQPGRFGAATPVTRASALLTCSVDQHSASATVAQPPSRSGRHTPAPRADDALKAVHIAGTKGKGSTAAFLSNILRVEGYNVGCYTSPHLLTIRERISVGKSGGPVSAELLRNLFNRAKEIIDQSIESENGALTHFEVFTALSCLLFSQENVDIAIIEAGLGGARDATNVIQSTELAVSVITSVGKEHLAALGGSIQSIAVAKSGIIKQGRPVVIGGPFLADIEQIIRDRAFLMHAPVISACDPGVESILRSTGWIMENLIKAMIFPSRSQMICHCLLNCVM